MIKTIAVDSYLHSLLFCPAVCGTPVEKHRSSTFTRSGFCQHGWYEASKSHWTPLNLSVIWALKKYLQCLSNTSTVRSLQGLRAHKQNNNSFYRWSKMSSVIFVYPSCKTKYHISETEALPNGFYCKCFLPVDTFDRRLWEM